MRSTSTKIVRTGVLACALGFWMAGHVFAQSDSARLQGVVTDSSGAVVPGATVTVQDVATNRIQKVTTGEGTGAWSFPVLPPGNYDLTVSKTGFKSMKQAVTLETAQVANVNLSLVPGDVATEVVVDAEAALVDTASSDIGLTVQTKQIQDLPLNGRNFTELATLIPGVSRGVPGNVATGAGNNAETFRYGTSGGASLVVNGSRPQANNFMLDGLDNNESLVNTIVFFPNSEAIQEFKVQTSVPAAEFGRAGGATVNTTLKSGTNMIHGSAWDYLRNSFFDARPTFASSIAPFRRNQFGGTFGAPIKKDKVFIFGDYQGFRQETPVGVDFATVPTPLMRQGNFSELLNPAPSTNASPVTIMNVLTGQPFPGNIIPTASLNAVGVKYLNAYPLPNVPGKIQQNFTIQRQQIQNFDDFDIRGDWNASDKDRIFVRDSRAHDNEVTTTRLPPNLPAGFGSGTQFTYANGGALGYTRVFTPALLSELRLGYQRTDLGYLPPLGDQAVSANLGIPNANTSPLLGGGALIGGYNGQLEYTGDYGTYRVPENTFQLAETMSWVHGNHTVKFGANIIRRQVAEFRPKAGKGFFNLFGNGNNGAGYTTGSTGYEVSDVLAGFMNNYQIGAQTGYFGTFSWEDGFYAQDDWHASRHLTLNLGLRWDYLTNPTEEHGRQSNFNLATGAIVVASGGSDPLIHNPKGDFGPRIGFAYTLDGAGKTVVRGGYGIFYFPDRGGIDNQMAQNAPFSGISEYDYSNGYRFTLSGQGPQGNGINGGLNWLASTGTMPTANFSTLNLAKPANISMAAFNPNNATSSTEQWNLQVQHELPGNMLLSVAYVGSAGHHLLDYYNVNNQLFNTAAGTKLYPLMGSINYGDARGNSIYNGLQAELTRRFTNGLQFTASYTHSKTIDDGLGAFGSAPQDFTNIRLDRGLADQDVRDRFVLSGVYELPFGHGRKHAANMSRTADTFIGGWQVNTIVTAQSGLPFGISNSGSPGGRPNLVGALTTYPGNTNRYFNTAAVQAVPTNSSGVMIRPGNLGRNVLIGPGIVGWNLSLAKNFALTERCKLEFRAETFNLANHPFFSNPSGDIFAGNFGQINGTLLSSERQMQFALKLKF